MKSKVTIILRNYTYEETKIILESMIDIGFCNVEITRNTKNSEDIIKRVLKEYGCKLNIGVGTIISVKDLQDIIDLNLKFILTPILVKDDVIKLCKNKNIKVILGAMTPTEIMQGFEKGADIIKVFPANILGNNYAKSIKAPLGDLSLMAVGGININNARFFLEGGYDYLGIGSSLFDKEYIKNKDRQAIKDTLLKLNENLIY